MKSEYYLKKLKEGIYYQDFVVEKLYECGLPIISYSSKEYQKLIGENKAGIEIKFDQKFKETGNFYIEVAEKTNPENFEWAESGIKRKDNSWLYAIGDLEEIFIFSKKQLQYLHAQKINGQPKYKLVETIPPGFRGATSKGFLLPIEEARKFWAIKIIEITEDDFYLKV